MDIAVCVILITVALQEGKGRVFCVYVPGPWTLAQAVMAQRHRLIELSENRSRDLESRGVSKPINARLLWTDINEYTVGWCSMRGQWYASKNIQSRQYTSIAGDP